MNNSAVNKNKDSSVYLWFTLAYFIFMGFLMYFVVSADHMTIYHSDAWRQHVKALTYYSKYLRGAVQHIFTDHSLVPQAYSFGIGYGSDILTTLQYYCFGDPLAFAVILVPTSYVGYYFCFLMILRPYLAGISFIAFLRYMAKEKNTAYEAYSLVTGAVVYAFSGTVLYIGMLHPYFVSPMFYFPLMLLGIEKIIHEKKPMLFTIVTCLCSLSNFYFFYMIALLTAVYGICRLVMIYGKNVKAVLIHGLKLLGYAGIGTMMSCFIFVPIVYQFMTDPRAQTHFAIDPLYNKDYYKTLFLNAVAFINHPQYDVELCLGILALFSVFLLYASKGHKYLKTGFACLCALLLFPAAGSMMNGFSYTINRWTWALEMLFAYIIVVILPEIQKLSVKRRLAVTIMSAVFTFIMYYFKFLLITDDEMRNARVVNVAVSLVLLWLCTALIWLPAIGAIKKSVNYRVIRNALCTICLLSVAANIYCGYSKRLGNFPNEFKNLLTPSEYYAAITDNEAHSALEAGGRDSFYRYTGRNLQWNCAMLEGVSSTQFCFSFANGTVSDYFQAVGNMDEQDFAYYGLDDRMIPNMLAGVRYYSIAYDNEYELQFVPYGFADIGKYGNFRLFESGLAMPLGYTYDRYLSEDDVKDLSTNERSQSMIYGAVLSKDDIDRFNVEKAEPVFDDESISYEVSTGEGVTYDGHSFNVTGCDQTATITFEGLPMCETYLAFDNMAVEGEPSLYQIKIEAFAGEEETTEKIFPFQTADSQYYSGWTDFAINMGFAAQGKTSIKLTFPAIGYYTFDDMRIVCQPLEKQAAKAQELKLEQMTNVDLHENPVSFATNTVTGDITVSKDKILLLNIPYSAGWTAYVDGEETEISKANYMFMALPLTQGTHSIRLEYHTPYGAAGYAVTGAGIVLFIIFVLGRRKNRVLRRYNK